VQKEVIGVAAISSEKSYYKYGESVTLTRSDVSNTSYYWITIIRDGKEIVSELMKSDSYEIRHAIAGEYQVYLEVGNVVSGQVTSEPYKFTVAEHDHVWKSKVIKEATATETIISTKLMAVETVLTALLNLRRPAMKECKPIIFSSARSSSTEFPC